MPYIDSKITLNVSDEKKENIKAELGKAISALNKSETYLMVGICDNYNLWMAGERLEKGVYVEVSLLGNATSEQYNTLTGIICDIYEKELGIPGNAVYVTYHPLNEWGWNGTNF